MSQFPPRDLTGDFQHSFLVLCGTLLAGSAVWLLEPSARRWAAVLLVLVVVVVGGGGYGGCSNLIMQVYFTNR